jgi:hypothetical protein
VILRAIPRTFPRLLPSCISLCCFRARGHCAVFTIFGRGDGVSRKGEFEGLSSLLSGNNLGLAPETIASRGNNLFHINYFTILVEAMLREACREAKPGSEGGSREHESRFSGGENIPQDTLRF